MFQLCHGEDVLLEIMKVVTELKEENKALTKKVITLEELDQQKEHRIIMFESKNNDFNLTSGCKDNDDSVIIDNVPQI